MTKEQLKTLTKNISVNFDFDKDLRWRITAVRRRKEYPNLTKNWEYIEIKYVKSYQEMLEFIDKYPNERIYLNCKPFDSKRVTASLLLLITESMLKNTTVSPNIYDKAVVRKEVIYGANLWQIDYNNLEKVTKTDVEKYLKEFTTILIDYPTRNGHHFIIKPFELMKMIPHAGNDKGEYDVSINNIKAFKLLKIPSFLLNY